MLLRRELDTRLQAVEQLLRRLAVTSQWSRRRDSLNSLAIAGMSRPLALLKTSSLIHSWARACHEKLTAIITLVDRLVISAMALKRSHLSLTERFVTSGSEDGGRLRADTARVR